MEISKVKLEELIDAQYNPRVELKPGDEEYEKLKKSIEHFGYIEPIIVNKRNMVVVGGHQRLHVMRDLGTTEAEVIFVDLDENDEKSLNIALNKISGRWDEKKLSDLLRDLSLDVDLNVSLTGFSKEEIDDMISDIDLPEDLDDYFRDLTEEEKEKKEAEASKIYITIGKDIKIEIDQEQYESIQHEYEEVQAVGLVSRLLGVVTS